MEMLNWMTAPARCQHSAWPVGGYHVEDSVIGRYLGLKETHEKAF